MSPTHSTARGPRVYIVTESTSRYALLGAFGTQFGTAMARCGLAVNPDAGGPPSWQKDGKAAYVFFNHLDSAEQTCAWAGGPEWAHKRAIVQWCVDHPLTIDAPWLDRMSRDPGFRLLTVTSDDAHLLSLRFPNLRHATVYHGVDDSALCDETTLAESHATTRDIDVLIAGSIAGAPELAQLKSRIPAALHGPCDELVQLRLAHPLVSFGQAMDITMPPGLRASDQWAMLQAIFAYTTAAVGRARRVGVAQAMQGLNVMLAGTEAWKEFATGTLRYAGQVAYGDLPAMLKRTKVCLAVSPPQFVTGFSERLLLSMAAGCATVADERMAIAREFAGGARPVCQYAPNEPERARVLVERMLANGDERSALGAAGRSLVAGRHLWVHRIGQVLGFANVLDDAAPQRSAA